MRFLFCAARCERFDLLEKHKFDQGRGGGAAVVLGFKIQLAGETPALPGGGAARIAVANAAQNDYGLGMTALERDILKALNELDATVKTMATANPKPSLLPLFQRLEVLANELPRSTSPDLLHYMQKKSYEKARLWLEGRFAEIQKGGCLR
jgi:hypothetical protein